AVPDKTMTAMHRVPQFTSLLLILLPPVLGTLSTLRGAEIVLKNGDRVTGAIVAKDGDVLTVESAHFGTITMPWAEVASVTSDESLHVVLAGDETVVASLQTEDDRLQLVGESTSRSVALGDIVALRDEQRQAEY